MVRPAAAPDPLRLASRMATIQPFYVMEIQRRAFELEAAGRSIIHFEIGQPDFGAAPSVLTAAGEIMPHDRLGYTDALGIPALRIGIAEWYRRRFAVTIDPAQVVVTTGASGAFLLACAALVGTGDEFLMPDPCYPCNRHFVRLFEGTVRPLPVDETTRYQPTAAQVECAWGPRTRGVMLASPSNPTGTTISTGELTRIAATVRARGGALVVDEIYQGLTYGDERGTALAVAPDAIVVNSFSKYFAMTGWRIGWLVAPRALVGAIERLAQNIYICPPALGQHAALAALQPEAVTIFEARRDEFARRREVVVAGLRALGFGIPVVPDGAFYVYADITAIAGPVVDSSAFAAEVLERAGVALTPGKDFGAHRAARYVRFAYTRSLADINEGLARLARHLGRTAP